MTHKGFRFDGAAAIGSAQIVNCRVVNWRGEAVYAGGTALKALLLEGTTVAGCNASAVSCSTALTMTRCTVGGPAAADQVYNGLENFEIVKDQKTVVTDSLVQCAPAAAAAHGNGVAWLGVPGASLVVQNTTFKYCRYGILFSEVGHNASITAVTFTDCVHASLTSILGLYPKYPRGFSNIAFTDCAFDGGSGFVCQGQDIADLRFIGCTVVKGDLISGTLGKCAGLTATKTTVRHGAQSAGTVKGTGVPTWSGTVHPTPTVKVDLFNGRTEAAVAPLNELTWLNAAPAKGVGAVTLDPKARNYPVGWTTTVYASKPGQWVLKADPATNTFPKHLSVPTGGLMVRINAAGKWELAR
jgi:hypothetical protein